MILYLTLIEQSVVLFIQTVSGKSVTLFDLHAICFLLTFLCHAFLLAPLLAINNIPVQQYSVTAVAQEASLNRERRASACGVSVSALDVHRVLPLPCLTGRQRERERERDRQQSHVSRAAVAGRARSWWQLEDDPGAGSLSNTRLRMRAGPVMPRTRKSQASQQIRGLGDIRPGCLPSVDSRTTHRHRGGQMECT
jgi:hypothetical protein